jgi:hypothetical protein
MKISYFDLALIALDGALVGLNVGLAIHSFIDGKTGLGFFQLGAAVVIGVITAWMIFMTSQRIKIHRTTERLNAYSEALVTMLDDKPMTNFWDDIDAHIADATRVLPWSKPKE